MKERITWFWDIDKRIWNDKIEANAYLATLSIMFVGLLGALSGGGRVFHEWFDWDTATNNVSMVALLILIWGLNLGESIIASKTALTALWRSLLLLVILLSVFAIGFIASVVVLFLVAAWVVLMVLSGALSGASKSSGGKGAVLDDGTKLTNQKGILGEDNYSDSSGGSWDRSGDTFTKR